MKYPNIPPRIEPREQISAKRKALIIEPRIRAIKRTSGGIGKKEDSANARRNKAKGP